MAVLQGALAGKVEGEVNFVNVAAIAEERGLKVRETKQPATVDYLSLITVRAQDGNAELSVSGTALGPRHRPRFVKVYSQDVDIEPAAHMVFLRYDDVPGMLGKVGTRMGEWGINIAQMSVGRSMVDRKAIMGLTIDSPVSREQVAELVKTAGLHDGRQGGAVGGVETL